MAQIEEYLHKQIQKEKEFAESYIGFYRLWANDYALSDDEFDIKKLP